MGRFPLPLVVGLASVTLGLCESNRRLRDLSLEELMNVPISTVEKRELAIAKGAAAVYVISREEIERSAAGTIPDLLRRVPGLLVAQIDANKWAIGGRGSNSRYTNKLLVLIDGRSIFWNVTGGVYWEHQDLLPDDVERIEVIRGPGATAWGAYAVYGIINIITRRAADTIGTQVSARSGHGQPLLSRVRHGAKAGDSAAYRVFATSLHGGPSAAAGGGPFDDKWRTHRAGGRAEWRFRDNDQFRVQGDVYSGRFRGQTETYPGPVSRAFGIAPPTAVSLGTMNGGYGLFRWDHSLSERSGFAGQASYQKDCHHEFLGGGCQHVIENGLVWNRASGRHSLNTGANFRVAADQTAAGPLRFLPANATALFGSAFLQDDIQLGEYVTVSVGARLLKEPYDGFHPQPMASVVWNLAPGRSLWASAATSVRAPTRRERQMSLVLDPPVMGLPGIAYVGNPAFESERLRSFDAGYRHEFRKASIDVAVYRSRILGNNTTTLGSLMRDTRGLLFLPFQPTNVQVSDGAGVEAATTWQPLRNWNVQFNYAHQHRTFSGPSSEALIVAGGSHSPHQATAISDWQLHPRVAWQHVLYAVAAARPVPGYTRLDSSLSFRVTSAVRLQVGGENLLSPRHLEYLSEDGTLPGLMRRGLFARAVWTR